MAGHRSLSQITKALLAAHNLHPKKRLGQNFLVDQGVLDRIINAAGLADDDTVLEIGAGLGVLTEGLAKRAKKVISLEVDPDLILICRNVLGAYRNIEIVRKSVLEWELPLGLKSFKIVGNLPYYISQPIIQRILEEWREKVSRAVLTVQKEFAERLASGPGGKIYGSLSIFAQNHARIEINSLVSKYSFYPKPGVSSAIVVLDPYPSPRYLIDHKLVRDAFSMRRKQIGKSLSNYYIDWEGARVSPKQRPEELSLAEFEKISTHKNTHKNTP